MFTHEVLSELYSFEAEFKAAKKREKKAGPMPNGFKVFAEFMHQNLTDLRRAQRFHFGDLGILGNAFKEGEHIFRENTERLRVPYETVWFEAFVPVIKIDDRGYNKKCKVGCLVTAIEKDLLHIITWSKMPDANWAPSIFRYYTAIGKPISRVKNLKNHIVCDFNQEQSDKTTLIYTDIEIPKDDRVNPDLELKNSSALLTFVYWALLLLNCKNIKAERVDPPIKLNKKRKKKNQPPLLSYHILKVLSPANSALPTSEDGPENMCRLHFCRGHLKIYTKERPLFGKIIGMFWWQPHIRGRSKKGMVLKDYEVCHENRSAFS